MPGEIVVENRQKSVVFDMADRFGMEPMPFEATLRATVFPSNGTREQFAAFLLVAKTHNLNPLTKEIYAFPAKGGGIVPIVSIDGWIKLINSHPKFDGMDCEAFHDDLGELVAMRCTIYRKDREHPTTITEYLSECYRTTEPWKMKHRMLRHKATIQCARYAFGFAGIYDDDEAERIDTSRQRSISPVQNALGPQNQLTGEANLERLASDLEALNKEEAGPVDENPTKGQPSASTSGEGSVKEPDISAQNQTQPEGDSPPEAATTEPGKAEGGAGESQGEPERTDEVLPEPTRAEDYEAFWIKCLAVAEDRKDASAEWAGQRALRTRLAVDMETVARCKAMVDRDFPKEG